jgi:peroxiredoxin
MNLEEQLNAKRIESESSREKVQVDIMAGATERLIMEGIEKSALGVGDKIPSFHLPNVHGQLIEISDLLVNGPLILTFYRGSWCPYCNLELRAYQKSLSAIKSRGAQVIAISPELPDSSLSNAEKLALDFEVLSDVGNVVAREFGLVFKVSEELSEIYKQLNSDITKHTGDDSWELPIPATYIVGSDSKIAFSYVNADYLERADPQQVVAALAELTAK